MANDKGADQPRFQIANDKGADQPRCRSTCAYVQADLHLSCSHATKSDFLALRLKYCSPKQVIKKPTNKQYFP